MEDLLILTVGVLLAVQRIWRRHENDRLVNIISYVCYYGTVTYYIYYCFLQRKMYLWGIGLIFIVGSFIVSAFPYVIDKMEKLKNINLVAWVRRLHQDVLQGFVLWGLLCYGIMYSFIQPWNILIAFAAYPVNALYRLLSESNRQSVCEMHRVQGLALLAGISISFARFEVNIQYHPFYVMVYTAGAWIVLMVAASLKAFDSNPGTTWELLNRNISELGADDIRIRRMFKRFVNLFVPLFAIAFTLYVENTLEFYYTNKGVFAFQISDFLGSMIIRMLVLTIIFSLLLTCLSSGATKLIGVIASGVFAASYLQIMIFDRTLGMTDNYVIDWSRYSVKMVVNGIIWLLVIGIPVWLYKCRGNSVYRIVKIITASILAIQMVAAVSLVYKSGGLNNAVRKISDYELTANNEFTVSQDRNIIVFVLDTFSSDYLDMMLEEYPDALDSLKDFTYYNNYDCRYDGTALAMNYLLSGVDFDNTVPCREYSRKAFKSESAKTFYGYMKSQGYECNLYTDKDTGDFLGVQNLYGLYDNVDKRENTTIKKDRNAIQGNMLSGALYRLLPLALKRYSIVITSDFDNLVYNTDENENPAMLDDEFYDKLEENGITYNSTAGTFAIYHFKGMHDYGYGSKRAKIPERANACIQDVSCYIDRLKEKGVYDSATIIITADHGQHETVDGIQPVFFIKKKNSVQKELYVNNAPISAKEFLPTILKAAGSSDRLLGDTVDDFKQNTERERTVYVRKYNYDDVAALLKSNINYSSYSMLYGYTYKGDKESLRKRQDTEPDIKLQLTDFWQ